jgi:hypothetical protein
MKITQVSVFLDNRKGRLAEVTNVMAAAGVDIRSLSLADASDFGILRLIVSDPGKCQALLKEHGFVAQLTEVLAVEIEDKPGGLARVLTILDAGGTNVEYMYAFVEKKRDNAVVIFKTADAAATAGVLAGAGIPLVGPDGLERL